MAMMLSNTRKMAPTLIFHFLSFILFFLTKGEGIIVENLKAELGNQDFTVNTHDLNPYRFSRNHETTLSIHDYKVNTHESTLWWYHYNHETKQPNDNYNLDHIEAFVKGFFTLDDLHVGKVMTLQFFVQEIPHFFSRKEEADKIPFSVAQLQSVLQLFSIPEDSLEAKTMNGTLEQCEAESVKGEIKICVNSVESMLEFVDTIIGSETKHNLLTTSYPSPSAIPLQKYTILEVSHDIDAPKWVSCHPIPYPYAVYLCHTIVTATKVFKVTLVGDKNGDIMETVGMCHLDTSDWNPNHLIFQTLKVNPGKNTSVCHFFSINHLIWVPLQSSKATL